MQADFYRAGSTALLLLQNYGLLTTADKSRGWGLLSSLLSLPQQGGWRGTKGHDTVVSQGAMCLPPALTKLVHEWPGLGHAGPGVRITGWLPRASQALQADHEGAAVLTLGNWNMCWGVTWGYSESLVGAGHLQRWGTAPGEGPSLDLLLYGVGETSQGGLSCFFLWTWFYLEFFHLGFVGVWVLWGFLVVVLRGFFVQRTKSWKNADPVCPSFCPWSKTRLAVVASGLVSKGIQTACAYNQM